MSVGGVWERIEKRQRMVEENGGLQTKPVAPEEYGRLVVAVQELGVIVGELQEQIATLREEQRR